MDIQKQIEEANKEIKFIMDYRFESSEILKVHIKKPIAILQSIISQQSADIDRLSMELRVTKEYAEQLENDNYNAEMNLQLTEQRATNYEETLWKYTAMIVVDSEDLPHDVGELARRTLSQYRTEEVLTSDETSDTRNPPKPE